ncbi:MAG: hypothetical protein ACI8W8_004235 [Rhodothermales bacterium]|jgi:hypothetical protein
MGAEKWGATNYVQLLVNGAGHRSTAEGETYETRYR